MTAVALGLLIIPVLAAAASLWLGSRAAGTVTAASGTVSFALVIALIPATSQRDVQVAGFIRVDALSEVFLLATGFLYACVAVYSIGYLRSGAPHGGSGAAQARYAHRFWAGLNLFAWSMLAAPMMGNLALLWIAIEVTTVVSALLVALEGTDGAVEAAWKYILIASAGLGVSLLATIFAYYAGARALGQGYDLAFAPLLHVAHALPHTPVMLAFVLAVLGYGTKMGLFPVHTWLPDAHSEAPAPVSALLSGSLLAVSFYAILRYYQITAATLGPRLPRDVLLAFGVASLLLAALYLLDQRDYKRLLAYSSIEHMGVLAIGVSFGAPIALAGVLLHVLAHAAAKGNAFMGAGVLVRKFATKHISSVTGGLDLLPWSGPAFLAAILALSAMPPFGIFRSEFEIVAGGLSASGNTAAAILIVLVTVAFFGLSLAANRMLLTPRRAGSLPPGTPARATPVPAAPVPAAMPTDTAARAGRSLATSVGPTGPASLPSGPGRPAQPASPAAVAADPAGRVRGEPSVWMVVPVLAGLIVLLVLGLHPPGALTTLMDHAVAALRGPA